MEKVRALHSRYNPTGEAERFLESLNLNDSIKIFILMEPGMGYLVPCIRKKNPAARIIALYAERMPGSTPKENLPDVSWSPQMKKPLRLFLEDEIPDIEAKAVKLIEWRPSLAVYGESYRYLLSETVEFIKQVDASARTQNQFGKRWFKNFFRNLNLLSEIAYPHSFAFPVLVTAAGPSLEETIPLIQKDRDKLFLLAVSSSYAALNNAGLKPDMIISTDGGAWSLLHLYECVRDNYGAKTFAVNLTAALPSQCKNSSMLILCDGTFWQTYILQKLNIPFIILPQRGTVSASALDLAFALTSGNVYISGVDLSHRDIQGHARPYSFDRLWHEKACRINPSYSQVFARSGLIKSGGSHNIYASWFSRQLADYPRRLFSLGANSRVFKDFETPFPGLNKGKTSRPVLKTISFQANGNPVAKNPAMMAALLLKTALEETQTGKQLYSELCPLLFPGQTPSAKELGEAIITWIK